MNDGDIDKKLERFLKRTVCHIHRVQNNMLFLITRHYGFVFTAGPDRFQIDDETCRQLMHNVMKHDASKFSFDQFYPYIEITEYFHQREKLGNEKYDYPEGVRLKTDNAIQDHYLRENHHPERLQHYAKKMTFLELVETCCDLQAMAQEYGEYTCKDYFETNWKSRMSQYFYDDFDWEVTKEFMSQIIELFSVR